MLQCYIAVQQKLPIILQYSGKYFYQLGQYYQCLDQSTMNYNLVTFKVQGTDINLGTQLGLCLPKLCQTQLITATINTLLDQMKLPFQVLHINNNVPDYHYPYQWTFYLTILITIITTGLVIAASLFPKISKISMFNIKQSAKIFKHNPNSNLNVLNGIRSISMIWVVLGHVMSYTISGSVNITSSMQKNTLLKPLFLIVQAGLFAVDIFFYVGGILLAYVFLRENEKSFIKYPLAFLQRVLRFWPSYLFAILIFYSVYLHLGDGPQWGTDQQTVRWCSNIWKPLLFVDNLVDNGETQCMGWGWYLQNDMQLFLLSLFVLFLYSIKPFATKIFIIFMIIGSAIFTYQWTYRNGVYVISHLNDFSKWGDYMVNVYMKPWARAPPYLLGLLLGIFYCEYLTAKKGIKKSQQKNIIDSTVFSKLEAIVKERRTIRIMIEWTGIAIIIFLITIPRTLQQGVQWPQYAHSLYQSLAKIIFVIGLSLTILPSMLGCRNSIINFSMDTRYFNFIGKISFCTYLIHLTILQIWVQSRTYSRYYTIVPPFIQFCGILILSLFVGLIMTFLIEIPFSKLQKKLINSTKNILMKTEQKKLAQTKTSDILTLTTQINLKESILSEN